ncbi:MAG: lysozyme inhibitor LprI family protein [Pseudomonadota bacterium]|nr:lysozyme inhibitor LprI family protein [Pseudomonadota bacterium]
MTPLLYPLLAIAAQAEQPDCANAMSQSELNQCAALDFEREDAALNAAWRDVLAYVRSRDAEGIPEWDPRGTGEARLREAQRAWIAFRDAHCELVGFEARGGTMEPMIYDGCRAEVTRARTEQLRFILGEP